MHDMVPSGSAQQVKSRAEIYAILSAKLVSKVMALSATAIALAEQLSVDPSASEKVSFVTMSYRLL